MQRAILGVIALLFLVGGVYLLVAGTASDDLQFVCSLSLRVGLVLGASWLAWPQLAQITQRFPPWLLGCLVLGGLVVIVRPRAILYVGPLVLILALLQFIGWLFKPLPRPPRRE